MKSWGLYIAVALGFFIYGTVTQVDRDDSRVIIGEGSLDAFHVRIGDCFDDAASMDDEISSLPGVPCSDPHDNEAYALINLSFDSYPENDGMAELAHESCLAKFDAFVGMDYESSSLAIFTMYPSVDSWKQDDREVICAIYDMNAEKLVGSMQSAAL